MKDANRSLLGRRGIPVRLASALTVAIAFAAGSPAGAQDLHETVRTRLEADYTSLETIHRDLHANPELSFMEDFTLFGRTRERVPIMMWRLGGTAPEKFEESRRTGVPVPSNHNSGFAPVPEPTLKAAATSMTAAVLELLGKP